MWNRLFKSKSSKEKETGKKSKKIKGSNSSESTKDSSRIYDNSKVICDLDDVIDPGPENVELVPCPICTRTFAPSALEKHVGICEKMHIQKRTPFDSFRQRREGTTLETYLPSNYGLIVKPKTSKLASPTGDSKSVSRSISSISSSVYDASNKSTTMPRRVTPTRTEAPKLATQETPLQRRSMRKQTMNPINEVCPHCGRSFGTRAFDRHVEWCAEKCKITPSTLSAQQHLAKERMQARTKYKAPSLRSKRDKNREKYSSLSESMNNLSDSGGISIMDFNSVADPYERGRKSSIMSLSMTSSIASDGGFSDKYDPFISAKRQFEDLFNSSGVNATSTPSKGSPTGAAKMTTSLTTTTTTAKSPSSPTKTPILSKSNFRRSSSLRVPSKKTSLTSFMPKYKPTIQRGISDEGPISSNFMKPEEYDELPVKSHAVIPPDLVPKSPKPIHNRDQPTPKPLSPPSVTTTAAAATATTTAATQPISLSPLSSSTTQSPIVVKRSYPNTLAIRRNMPYNSDSKGPNDFPLTKTDSLAAFLKFEDDVECMDSGDERKPSTMSEKELKDKSNNLNKKSLFERMIDNNMTNESISNEFGDFGENDESQRLPSINSHKIQPQQQQQNTLKNLAPLDKPLIKHKIVLEPLTTNPECNNNINNHNNISNNHNHNNRIDENDNSIDSNLINSCDNLRISNLSKLLNNESSVFDQSSLGGGGGGGGDDSIGGVSDSADASIQSKQNQLVTNATNSNQSTRDSSSADSLDTHQHMERIANMRNINDTNLSSRDKNPKRQLQLHKDSLLFDSVVTTASIEDIDDDDDDDDNDVTNGDSRHSNQLSDMDINLKTYSSNESSPKSQTNSRLSNIDESNGSLNSRKLSASDQKTNSDRQDIESLFEDFDLEEFISSFSDNEQFPIFKNYKQMLETNGRSTSARTQHGSESTSEESEFDYKYETSDFDTPSERERTLSANSFGGSGGGNSAREKAIDQLNSLEFKEKRSISFDENSLKRPDVTVDAEKRMHFEAAEQHCGGGQQHKSIKLNPMHEIFNENDELMSEAERDLLTSVQELNSMCEDSNTLDLTSCLSSPAQKDESPVRLEASFKSLFLRSPADSTAAGNNTTTNGSIRFNQRNRHQPILSYQMPEIVGLSTPSAEKDFNRMKTVTTSPHEQFAGKTDATKLFQKESTTKLNSPSNGFDRTLPPIILHKNDSQNIYNTINMTSGYHHDGSMTSRSDSLLTNNNGAGEHRKLSTTSLTSTTTKPSKDVPSQHLFNAMKLSKFCHECGAKFIVDQAKFCMDCGAKRAALD